MTASNDIERESHAQMTTNRGVEIRRCGSERCVELWRLLEDLKKQRESPSVARHYRQRQMRSLTEQKMSADGGERGPYGRCAVNILGYHVVSDERETLGDAGRYGGACEDRESYVDCWRRTDTVT
ncbi:hypothetical protein KP509_1Z166300 [Ceratopteris richardii]|nr:hypothetical protein KP509_1Z166300 [Ceratopteris richardii]